MKEKINFQELTQLSVKESSSITGGSWKWVLIGYVAGEIANGIQRGLSADCCEVQC